MQTSCRTQNVDIPNYIYNVRNVKKGCYYYKLDKFDLIDKFLPELAGGSWIMNDRGLFERTIPKGIGYDTPWKHQRLLTSKRCSLDHFIKFNYLGYIPPRCLKCFKIVVAPWTVKELFELQKIQKDMDVPSKCGIEVRKYTARLYGGYFYTNSISEGLKRYKEVRKQVDDRIGKHCPVLLKRGCTEMELLKGPSNKWMMPVHMQELDEYIDNRFDMSPYIYTTNTVSDTVDNHTKKLWIEWAYAHGDETYAEYTDGEPLWNPPFTYHEMEETEAKKELILGKAEAVKINKEAAETVINQLAAIGDSSMMSKYHVNLLMGHDKVDPMMMGDLIEWT